MDQPKTVVDLFLRTVEKYADKTALIFYGKRLTYRELDNLSTDFALFLTDLNIGKGDRVFLLLPNCPQFVIAYLGILKVGGVVAAMNPLTSVKEIAAMAQLADAKLVITLVNDSFSEANQAICENLSKDQTMMRVDLADYLPKPLSWIYRLKMSFAKVFVPPRSLKWNDYKLFLGRAGGSASFQVLRTTARHLLKLRSDISVDSSDLAVLQYTGGTTGTPKAAMLTHGNIVSNCLQALRHVNRTETVVSDESVMLGVIPFFHVYGLSVCLNLAFAVGSTVVLLPKFSSKEVFKAIQKYEVNIFPAVPRMFAKLNENEVPMLCPTLRLCLSGAGALDSEVKKTFEAMTGAVILEGYGLSEASPIVSVNPTRGTKPGSLGTLLPETEMKIVNGELWVRGPQVMRGYWRNEAETKQVLVGDGWLVTGDLVKLDQDNFLWFDGRKKELIKVNGENVYPKQIEETLKLNPAVLEAAVLGLPDPQSGEKVVACVVLKDGNVSGIQRDPRLESDLKAFCRAQGLNGVRVPKEVVTVPEIPKTVVGKVLKRVLKEQLSVKAS